MAYLKAYDINNYYQCLKQKKTDQSRFNRQKRLTRAQPFVIANHTSLSGQSVLLIDDVYTTGRTLYYAAELIYTLGAKNVKSLSLAR
ncbi:ComF family protein [Leuconostoc citreum]|uniref:ComF family protein n=1 Tax=Leuconostoc citreum TaxID=33964 RepID=UPI00288AF0E4|nr:phosphoribosyltransferase family protein [Leuconostoc citreum]